MEIFCRFVKWTQLEVKVKKKKRIDFYMIVFAHACLDSATEENKIQEILTISLITPCFTICVVGIKLCIMRYSQTFFM